MKAKTIAWIEDDYKTIGALTRLLQDAGHKIVTYGSWQEVKKKIEDVLAADAIILDIILPPIEEGPYTGVRLLRQLRQEHKYSGPVIVCTGVRNPEVHAELENMLGATGILRKPVRPSELFDKVIDALMKQEEKSK